MVSNSYRVSVGLVYVCVCVGVGTIYGVGDGSGIYHAVMVLAIILVSLMSICMHASDLKWYSANMCCIVLTLEM